MEISSRYHELVYLLWIGAGLLAVGGLLFLLIWLATGGTLFDTPEPGLEQLTHYHAFSEYPAWSPDGSAVLFQSSFEDPEGRIDKLYSLSLDDRLVRRVETYQLEPYMATWSPDGNTIAFSNWRNVCLAAADGDGPPDCVAVENARWLSWRPDGRELVFDDGGTIYRLPVRGGKPAAPLETVGPGTSAAWSPDGGCLAYAGGKSVWIMQADGSSPVELPGSGATTYPFGWSSDGQFLLVNKYPSSGASNLYAIRLADGKKIRLTNNHEYHTAPRLSPDGTRIAFHSLRYSKIDGYSAYNIYMMRIPALPAPPTPIELGDCQPPIARTPAATEPAAVSEPGGRSTPSRLEKSLAAMNLVDVIFLGVLVLLLVLGLLAVGYSPMRAIGALHFQRFRMDTEAGFRNMAYHSKLQALVAELEAQGFTAFGVLAERTFYGREVKSLSLGSVQAKAFANITLRQGKACYYYYTPFIDGSVLLTANGGFSPIRMEGYFVQTIPSGSPSTLLAAHQERLRFFTARGRIPASDYTPESRLEATRQFYANRAVRTAVRRSALKSGALAALAFLIPIAAISAYLAVHTGFFLSDAARYKWKIYHASAGGFSVAMPHTPQEKHSGSLHLFLDNDAEFTYSVAYFDYVAGDIQRLGVDRILEDFQNQVIPAGGMLVFAREFFLDDHPGREFRARESDTTVPHLVEGRVVLVDRRVYRVAIRYRLPSALSQKIPAFLDSFQLGE